MRDLIWNSLSPDTIAAAIVKARDTALDAALDTLTPPVPGADDTLLQGHTYEVGIATLHGYTEWLTSDEDTWRSWTGLRKRDGEDHHGPIYVAGTERVWDGKRDCACARCSESMTPALRHN